MGEKGDGDGDGDGCWWHFPRGRVGRDEDENEDCYWRVFAANDGSFLFSRRHSSIGDFETNDTGCMNGDIAYEETRERCRQTNLPYKAEDELG